LVQCDFHHPIHVNSFAPWIAFLFLVKGLPHPVTDVHHVVWYILMVPIPVAIITHMNTCLYKSGRKKLSTIGS
jgi:hypothetical protein